ncbi:F-box/kelch-repeat protein At1g57790-like [Quercus robur]|uniref:F-box/kelch-repeat protein At1g57790-like n=1 Tax=Quercus robur TaxID=38942 RepID=UPI002163CF3F|nr:F-box/kelch-repeat protein At1g57790-like [Quercus robur]
MEVEKVENQNTHSYPFIASRLYPWLVILDVKQGQRQTFFDVSKNHYQTKNIPEMCNKLIYACSHGWLVLVDPDSMDCYLWNPISLEKALLPSLKSINYSCCILSSSPSDPECHILFFNRLENSLLVCQKGDFEFNEQVDIFAEDVNLKNVAMVGKTIYCLASRYTLYTAEVVGRTVQFTRIIMEELPWPSPLDLPRFDAFIVESCGELFLVHMMFFGFRMEEVYGFFVFRMDFEEKRWVKVKSIGDRTIFLCQHNNTGCMHSLATELGIKTNSIYFTMNCQRLLYVFDLESLCISKSLPCSTVSRDLVQYWVMI